MILSLLGKLYVFYFIFIVLYLAVDELIKK